LTPFLVSASDIFVGLSELLVHPTSLVLLTKTCPLGALSCTISRTVVMIVLSNRSFRAVSEFENRPRF
jgi:hypothetical protein